MINKILLLKEKSNSSNLIHLKSKSINNSLEERSKLCEIKLIDNLFNKKLKKEYIDKSSLLFYSCKNIKNYPYLRKNIDKTIYDYDENNELIVTIPKFHFEQKHTNNQNNNNISSIKNFDDTDISNINNSNNKNIFRTSNTNLLNSLNVKDGKKNLIDYRNNRNVFNKKNIYSNICNNSNKFKNIEKMPLPRILSNKNLFVNNNPYSKYSLLETTNSNNIEYSPNNIIYESENGNKICDLYNNQKKLFSYFSELNFFKSRNKVFRKKYKSKNSSFDIKKNKIYFNYIFNSYGKNLENNGDVINKSLTIDKKNEIQMSKIKNNTYKLKKESFKVKDDVEKAINEIDQFLAENEDKSMKILKSDSMKKPKKMKSLKNL